MQINPVMDLICWNQAPLQFRVGSCKWGTTADSDYLNTTDPHFRTAQVLSASSDTVIMVAKTDGTDTEKSMPLQADVL